MIKKAVSKRYARAIFDLVQPEAAGGDLEPTLKSLEEVAETFRTHGPFRHLMLSPRFDRESKIRVFRGILERMQVGALVERFLIHLVKRNRFQLIEEMAQAFATLVADFRRVITVPVRTAREPSTQDREALKQRLESMTRRTVQVDWAVDSSLIGGMIIRIGETVVDGSIQGQLEAMRKKLVEA